MDRDQIKRSRDLSTLSSVSLSKVTVGASDREQKGSKWYAKRRHESQLVKIVAQSEFHGSRKASQFQNHKDGRNDERSKYRKNLGGKRKRLTLGVEMDKLETSDTHLCSWKFNQW